MSDNRMSQSLLMKEVYACCFTGRDSIEVLNDELARARENFFGKGRKAVYIYEANRTTSMDIRLRGKLSKHTFSWKKSAGKITLEEAFSVKGNHVVVVKGYSNILTKKIFTNREQLWIKTEYYDPSELANPQIILKPSSGFDAIEKYDFDKRSNIYNSEILYPAPFLTGTAEQSMLNSRFGDPQVIIKMSGGSFCYCPKEEAEARNAALREIGDSPVILMPTWEVRAGEVSADSAEDGGNISFTSLEEYAKVTQGEMSAGEIYPTAAENSEGLENIPEEYSTEQASDTSADEDYILAAAQRAAGLEAAEVQAMPAEMTPDGTEAAPVSAEEIDEEISAATAAEAYEQFTGEDAETASLERGYRGAVINGQVAGRGRTEQESGLTAYDGEYKNGKRDGFGAYYYKDGKLCYAGSWKDDKKSGLGVSFRNSDGALHIAKWDKGEPGGFVSLFDTDGNLRYGGRIIGGMKQGVGVSYNSENGTVFIGKWKDNVAGGYGSIFDSEGNLLYTGMWKDGKRNGDGTEFDTDGGIVFTGEWKDDRQYNGILYKKPKHIPEEDEG